MKGPHVQVHHTRRHLQKFIFQDLALPLAGKLEILILYFNNSTILTWNLIYIVHFHLETFQALEWNKRKS